MLQRALEWLEINIQAWRLSREPTKPLAAQKAISLCYVCNLCGTLHKIRTANDMVWIHHCDNIPTTKA